MQPTNVLGLKKGGETTPDVENTPTNKTGENIDLLNNNVLKSGIYMVQILPTKWQIYIKIWTYNTSKMSVHWSTNMLSV